VAARVYTEIAQIRNRLCPDSPVLNLVDYYRRCHDYSLPVAQAFRCALFDAVFAREAFNDKMKYLVMKIPLVHSLIVASLLERKQVALLLAVLVTAQAR
jgi:hypothetical protein